MYTRDFQLIKNFNNVSSDIFIKNNDYINSTLLYRLDHFKDFNEYQVTRYEGRIDLISEDIYKSKNYSWMLLYINKIKNDDIIRGTILKYINLTDLNSIISSI